MSKSNTHASTRTVALVHIGDTTPMSDALMQSLSTAIDAIDEEQPTLLLPIVHLTSASQIPVIVGSCKPEPTTSLHRSLIIISRTVQSSGITVQEFGASRTRHPSETQPVLDTTNDLLHQLVSIAKLANIPAVAANTGNTGNTGNTPFNSVSEPAKEYGGAVRHGNPHCNPHSTVNIREDYRHHDTALLLRQALSLLDITIEDTSFLLHYPITPERPGGTVPLDRHNLTEAMSAFTPDWKLQIPSGDTNASELYRELRFSSFQDAIRYLHHVAPACDIANHHPRWENNWRTLRIWLTTWDAEHQITSRDIDLARYFDHVYTEYG